MTKTKPVITSELCSYGCEQVAKYVNISGRLLCCQHHNSCPALRLKNKQGLLKSYESGARKSGPDRYKDLPQDVKDRMNWAKGKNLIPNADVFKTDSAFSTEFLRKRIAQSSILDYRCSNCGLDEWQGLPLCLDLDHINGINNDNRIENLRFLCPNCHSQTETYKGKNIPNKGIKKVSDEELLTALSKTANIRKALLSVGLTPKGGNYERVHRLMLNVAR